MGALLDVRHIQQDEKKGGGRYFAQLLMNSLMEVMMADGNNDAAVGTDAIVRAAHPETASATPTR